MITQKLTQKIGISLTAATVFAAGIAVTAPAHADVSASVAVSNLYLFRGKNFSASAPQVSGSIDWSHDTGLYAGVSGSSEGASGQEVDLYAGFANEVDGFSYDLSLVSYEYPGATGSEDYGDVSEFVMALGMGGFSFTLVDALYGSPNNGDYYYLNFGYEMDKFGGSIGTMSSDSQTEYTHLDLTYAATDELGFTLSTIIDDDNTNMDTDPLFVVTWSKSFDL